MNSLSTKKAFTLAEVLITLGVIGVVAALTLPVLVGKYQEHVTVNKVKKWYSMFSQAILLSMSENGYPNEWNVSGGTNAQGAEELAEYVKPYLKIVKDCGTQNICSEFNHDIYKLNGVNGGNINETSFYYKLILADGSHIWFDALNENFCASREGCAAVYYDINGSKEPNTYAKDIFKLYIRKTGVQPPTNVNDTCRLNSTGTTCLVNILKDSKMNYLHK